MNPGFPSIDLTDYFTLLAVWELQNGYWQLHTMTRKMQAITLVNESPSQRLIFPTNVNPHGVWGGITKRYETNRKRTSLRTKIHNRMLTILKHSPGQSKQALAEQIGISVATTEQILDSLEQAGTIYHCPQQKQNKSKLYYLATSASKTA